MPAAQDSPYRIDDETAEFIQHFVSINVASRNLDYRPAVARAAGCRIDEDRTHLTVYVDQSSNRQLLENLRANGCLAVVFSRPSSHRTIQFKGNDATLEKVNEADLQQIRDYLETFRQELRDIGFPEPFYQAILPPAAHSYVGIRFSAERAYSQTPGPDAGKKLSS
jgi:hypothetical protein